MNDVLISIKPPFVTEILNGNKKFEYRKRIFKKEVDKIYIYSTYPQKRIVGYFKYNGYLELPPTDLWERTKTYSGISQECFFRYFKNSKVAYAIIIDKIEIFSVFINPWNSSIGFTAPQSYTYIKGDILYNE